KSNYLPPGSRCPVTSWKLVLLSPAKGGAVGTPLADWPGAVCGEEEPAWSACGLFLQPAHERRANREERKKSFIFIMVSPLKGKGARKESKGHFRESR